MKYLSLERLALLAVILGLISVKTAQAGTTDVLLGFNDAAASSASAQNDYVIDLGMPASTLVTAAGTNGGSYTFANIISASTFSAAFSADANDLNDVAVGVVAGYTGLFPQTLFQTAPNGVSGLKTWTSANEASWAGSATYAQAATIGEYASGGSAGWSQYVAISPTTIGNNLGGSVAGDSGNPTALLSSGAVSEALFESTLPSGSRGTSPTAWTQVGTFSINVNTHNVTFTLGSSPAPTISSVGSAITNGFSPLKVVFTNSTSGSISSWVWNFGNGTIITNTTGANVTNTYTMGGDYTVTLTVYGPGGSNTSTLANYVVASPSPRIFTTFANNNFVLSGTNCPAGLQYRLLSSTNLALPLAEWQPVFTNTFLNNGSFAYTNSVTNTIGFFELVSP